MFIILDSGHGNLTPGKRSPDGLLREYKYCREISAMITEQLTKEGYEVCNLMAGIDKDESLSSRCKRVNALCKAHKDSFLISVHNNASGSDGKWHTAKGWSVFISQNASNKSKKLAECLFDAANEEGLKLRKPMQTQKYWVQNLAMCRDTNCPAVLTENLFQDNKEDVNFLLSEEGKQKIVDLHIKGIKSFIELCKD